MWLPPEIWIHIFLLAASAAYTPQLYEIDYIPFHNPPREQERVMLNLADQAMLALSLVSREWHRWTMQFLFQTVRLSWYGSRRLHEGLQRSVNGAHCGQWTKRLELSVIEHEDSSYLVKPADILLCCPNIEVLVKYEDDLLPHSAEGVDLARLRRFDWYYARYRDGDHQFATEDDDPSRGQDFLREVVRNAPNLQYLSLVKRFRGNPRLGPPPSSLLLPALVTLHVQLISLDVWTEIETWSFPRLKVLRVDAAFISLTGSSDRMWPTVEVVELLQDQGSIPSPSKIPCILATCPNAIELNYYIEYVQPPRVDDMVAALVQVVRLHFATNYDLRLPIEDPEEDELWNHISAHFDMLTGPMFPALNRVVLCGPWNFVVENERYGLFKKTLVGRSCRLDLE
ncbi:hypothetical protein C8F04DRAFT_1094870 [Mycena alexandri]|uniref:F-box domain-containing protein n=1 Tax=Mycena alexandri TaxID=1745969 RepID=A0AAD6SYT4_9AGAR|nr:hypothetical protein C8F04DRAFT_1094870 [Mycena alexandri]